MPGVPGSPEKIDRRSYPFIKLLRRFEKHRFWRERRKYSKAEAWIDMLFMAYHSSCWIKWNGQPVRLQPGEFMTSVPILERRWLWSRNKVRRFLRSLEKEGEIVLGGPPQRTPKRTKVTICNYAEIHGSAAPRRTPPVNPLQENVVTRENTGRSAQRKSTPSVITERLPSCDRKPGDWVSEAERLAVRAAIRAAGFGEGGD